MIYYKDKTFCIYSTCKNFNNGCDRALTDEVREDAYKWWGNNQAPIMCYIHPPNCYEGEES